MHLPDNILQKLYLPYKAVHIQCLNGDGAPIKDAYGTGFVRQEGRNHFLYTCWHLVTGFNMHDPKIPRRPPDKRMSLRITLQNAVVRQPDTAVVGGNQTVMTVVGGNQTQTVPLYDTSQTSDMRPLWSQDKDDVPHADLNAVNLRVPLLHDAVKLRLPADHRVPNPQIIKEDTSFEGPLVPGDKLFVVGFPYGYSPLDMDQPTAVVLTRFVAATHIKGRRCAILLDGVGAPGMSGGPVFVENAYGVFVVGLYTGCIKPDYLVVKDRAKDLELATALGTCCDMTLCWMASPLEPCFASSPIS